MPTINQKTIQEVLTELKKPFPAEEIKIRDFDNQPYISVGTFIDRLNEVLGADHYSDEYSDITIFNAKDSYCVSAVCTLSILDDDYKVIFKKSMAGGSNINFPKDKETKTRISETTSMPNDIASACQDAFKRVCSKRLGIGDEQLTVAAQGVKYDVILDRPLREYNGNIFGDIRNGDSHLKLAVFKSVASTIENKEELLALKAGSSLCIYGTMGEDKNGNPQIIAKSLTVVSSTGSKSSGTPAPEPKKEGPEEKNYSVRTAGGVTEMQTKGNYMIPVVCGNEKAEMVLQADKVARLKEKGCWDTLISKAIDGIDLSFVGKMYRTATKNQLVVTSIAA